MSRYISDGRSKDERAASELVAVTLLFGIVILGVLTIALIAGPQLIEGQETAEVRQAERALVQYDSAATRVATGSTTSRTVDLGFKGNGGTLDGDADSGRIRVVYVNSLENGTQTEIANTSLGTVSYRNGDTTVAYQGGGVWRRDGNGTTMVSPPAMSFSGKTLTMHVVETEPKGSLHSDVQLSRANASQQRYPDAAAGLDNKVEGALVMVTVQSEYYRAWGQFFEDETNTIVQYDDKNQKATILFVALPVDYSPTAGVVSTSGPGEIRLEGNGAYIDSYNSSNGTYGGTRSTDGNVKSAGSVTMFGGSEIDGDAKADKDISVESGSAQIDGNASSGQQVYEHDDDSVTGEVSNNTSGVPPIPPIDGLVDRKLDGLASNNDNNETTVVDENQEIDLTGSNELGPGRYHLENLELEDETLVLNATNGNITIGVEDWMKLYGNGGGGHIRIKGDGEVRLFLGSEAKTTVNTPSVGTQQVHFYVESNSSIRTVDTPRQRSTQFLVFGPSHFEGAIAGNNAKSPNVTAVIIAPAGPAGEGNFQLKHGELYGAIMTGNLTLGKPSAVHFDHAVIGTQIPLAPTVPRLEYLYVTEHEVEVEES